MEKIISSQILEQWAQHAAVSAVLWVVVVLVILLDLWDRVYTNHKLHKPLRSHRFRMTIAKISEYWRIMLIGFFIDSIGVLLPFYVLPYVSMVLCVGLILTEAKSMREHAKERKSGVTQLNDIFKAMVDCATADDAKEVIKKIGEYLNENGHGDTK